MNVAETVEELRQALLSDVRWHQFKAETNLQHYVGDHPKWVFHLLVSGDVVDGGATSVQRGLVVRLTPELAAKAHELALKAAL
jgi:hypothetical protein